MSAFARLLALTRQNFLRWRVPRHTRHHTVRHQHNHIAIVERPPKHKCVWPGCGRRLGKLELQQSSSYLLHTTMARPPTVEPSTGTGSFHRLSEQCRNTSRLRIEVRRSGPTSAVFSYKKTLLLGPCVAMTVLIFSPLLKLCRDICLPAGMRYE